MELKEENFRKIADDLPFGLYIVEPDRTIVYWNKEAEQILSLIHISEPTRH